PEAALGWIAFGHLTMKGAAPSRAAVQKLLINAATARSALFEALTRALDAIEASGQKITGKVISRIIDAIEAYVVFRNPNASREITESKIARLASTAKRMDMARLIAALLPLQSNPPVTKPGKQASPEADGLIAEAAWSQADDALARALQNVAALTH